MSRGEMLRLWRRHGAEIIKAKNSLPGATVPIALAGI